MVQPPAAAAADTLEAPKSLLEIFPPVRKSHILNCAFATWHPIYRPITPKARTIPLTPAFLSYLREDGIVLPDDEEQITTLSDSDTESDDETEDDDEGDGPQRLLNPTARFPELHQRIKTTMRELGGCVAPKLNWSAPKDAAFMTATNTLECRTPGEVYLLLKSSDFVTHDLEHAFRDCADDSDSEDEDEAETEGAPAAATTTEGTTTPTPTSTTTAAAPRPKLTAETIPYHLVLRKWFAINPSLEFRAFVSSRRILAITQRDLNHYDFLPALRPALAAAIAAFFHEHLAPTFPDPDFVFDVYVPHADADADTPPRVWLVDINPFAPRTDTILFSWVEILRLRNGEKREGGEEEVELRLVGRDDPEAFQWASPQYGASKLPRDVVEVGLEGEEAVWEFARRWREIVEKTERERDERVAAAAAAAARR